MDRRWRSLTLTFPMLVFARTAVAHEKWFHKGAWQSTNWHTVVQLPTVVLIGAVVVVTILAALARRHLGRPNIFPGPVALGARPEGITRFYAWVPVILGIHVACHFWCMAFKGTCSLLT